MIISGSAHVDKLSWQMIQNVTNVSGSRIILMYKQPFYQLIFHKLDTSRPDARYKGKHRRAKDVASHNVRQPVRSSAKGGVHQVDRCVISSSRGVLSDAR